MAQQGQGGAQTLARGIAALRAVVESPDGITAQELADRLDVHRTIAYRILVTLAESALIARGDDGRYRGAAGLLPLAAGAYAAFVRAAVPVLRTVAEETGATSSLLVAQGGEAVALAVLAPETARYRIVFAEGSAHPLDRGAAGHALSALTPATPSEASAVAEVRERGYAMTFAEVEPGAYGVAVPVVRPEIAAPLCLNLITFRRDVAEAAVPAALAAARSLAAL